MTLLFFLILHLEEKSHRISVTLYVSEPSPPLERMGLPIAPFVFLHSRLGARSSFRESGFPDHRYRQNSERPYAAGSAVSGLLLSEEGSSALSLMSVDRVHVVRFESPGTFAASSDHTFAGMVFANSLMKYLAPML